MESGCVRPPLTPCLSESGGPRLSGGNHFRVGGRRGGRRAQRLLPQAGHRAPAQPLPHRRGKPTLSRARTQPPDTPGPRPYPALRLRLCDPGPLPSGPPQPRAPSTAQTPSPLLHPVDPAPSTLSGPLPAGARTYPPRIPGAHPPRTPSPAPRTFAHGTRPPGTPGPGPPRPRRAFRDTWRGRPAPRTHRGDPGDPGLGPRAQGTAEARRPGRVTKAHRRRGRASRRPARSRRRSAGGAGAGGRLAVPAAQTGRNERGAVSG